MTNPFSDLLERSVKPSRLVVGLMSGTSADSIDVAICRMKGQGTEIGVELIHYREHAHDPEVKRQVLRASDLDLRAIAELNVLLGEAFAEACLLSLKEASVSLADVDLIGSHGQTVYHHSGVAGARRATLQLGDGDIIAVRTGRYVISDFRARDIAAGGEGAPLSPVADTILFAGRESLKNHAEGRFSISVGSPISRCSMTIQLAFSDSTPDQPMRRSTVWHAISLAANSHVIKTGDSPGQDKSTSRFSAELLEKISFWHAVRRNRPDSRCTATHSSPKLPSDMVATTWT